MKAFEILAKAGLQNTRWGNRIIAAEQRHFFTAEDILDSEGWTTCACGELDESLMELDIRGELTPIDHDLYRFGIQFYRAITDNDYAKTANIIVGIENRVQELSL